MEPSPRSAAGQAPGPGLFWAHPGCTRGTGPCDDHWLSAFSSGTVALRFSGPAPSARVPPPASLLRLQLHASLGAAPQDVSRLSSRAAEPLWQTQHRHLLMEVRGKQGAGSAPHPPTVPRTTGPELGRAASGKMRRLRPRDTRELSVIQGCRTGTRSGSETDNRGEQVWSRRHVSTSQGHRLLAGQLRAWSLPQEKGTGVETSGYNSGVF